MHVFKHMEVALMVVFGVLCACAAFQPAAGPARAVPAAPVVQGVMAAPAAPAAQVAQMAQAVQATADASARLAAAPDASAMQIVHVVGRRLAPAAGQN